MSDLLVAAIQAEQVPVGATLVDTLHGANPRKVTWIDANGYIVRFETDGGALEEHSRGSLVSVLLAVAS